MGFVEGILGEIHHIIIDAARNLLTDSLGDAARYSLLRVSVDEVCALLLHDRLLFLTHGTAHEVAPPHGIAAQITHNLHNLLLIDNTAVGGLQNRLELRTGVDDLVMVVFSFYVSRNEIHRARTVQGNTGNDILKALRPQFLHEVLHSGALQLEDSLRLSGSDICQHLWIIVVNVVNVHPLTRRLLDKVHRIPYDREVPQT